MINLVPTDAKSGITYARYNLSLLRWAFATFIGVLGIGAVIIAGHFYINYSTQAYAKQVARTKEQLAAQKLDETQKRVEEISTSTKLVSQVLSREILFSKLLQSIGAAMPPGASLQNLSIGKLEGGLDLQVVAANYQTATQVQVNLEDPANKIFEKADILNVTCSNEALDARYPCQIAIRALFAKDSAYLYTKTSEAKP